jgi:hypothetical protein
MKIEAEKGDNIYSAAKKACLEALIKNKDATLIFNGIEIKVYRKSLPENICEIYDLKSQIRQLKK